MTFLPSQIHNLELELVYAYIQILIPYCKFLRKECSFELRLDALNLIIVIIERFNIM